MRVDLARLDDLVDFDNRGACALGKARIEVLTAASKFAVSQSVSAVGGNEGVVDANGRFKDERFFIEEAHFFVRGDWCADACAECSPRKYVIGSGEPAAPRRQSLLRSQARCALLPAATPRLRAGYWVLRCSVPTSTESPAPTPLSPGGSGFRTTTGSKLGPGYWGSYMPALKRGVAAGRSAQRACERSSDWRRGAAGSPDPDYVLAGATLGSLWNRRIRCRPSRPPKRLWRR